MTRSRVAGWMSLRLEGEAQPKGIYGSMCQIVDLSGLCGILRRFSRALDSVRRPFRLTKYFS